jgi:flavodoxin
MELIIMKTLIVYDSFFGNTEKIAQAMGSALGLQGGSEVIKVSSLKPDQLQGIDLLIVGSPTRGFRPSEGIMAFLKGLAVNSLKGTKVAAFDTRMKLSFSKPLIIGFFLDRAGYAAKPIADGLKKAGGVLAALPEGFLVKASEGPLYEGEIARAAAWAKTIKVI